MDQFSALSLGAGSTTATDSILSEASGISAETANQWTHGFGFCLSLAGAGVMLGTISTQADRWQSIGCAVYAFTLVALYLASTLSHSFADPVRRRFFRTVDQVCILLLSVGSFTPFVMTHLRDGWWLSLLAGMWAMAVAAAVVRIIKGENSVAFLFFAVLGWMPALAMSHVAELSGRTGLLLVIGGGFAYTGGIWFLVNDWRHRYLHAVWHLCTITGSACHFLFLQWYVAEWPLG